MTPVGIPVVSPSEQVCIDTMGLIAALPASHGESAPLAPAQAVVGEGRTIYTVLRLLDQGGMGTVYEARDGSLNRTVALKVMRSDQDLGAVARFIEEAQLTSQLEHPNIVPLHELGVDADGRLFFAMKMIRGETLAARLTRWKQRPLSAALIYEAMTLVVKVCDALAYAHDRGVVHRDIKPANIMLGAYGEVLVMDWGVARIQHARAANRDPATRATARAARRGGAVSVDPTVMTQEGDVVGTPGYMPPEQARGDANGIGPAADVYAVGAVIYEILTGSPPVAGRTLTEIISRTIGAPIKPPSLQRADRVIPAELEAVAMKALARDPAARYANARVLSQDLQSYLAGRSVSALKEGFGSLLRRLVRRNRAITATLAGSALAVLLIAAIAFTRVVRERDLAQEARDQAQLALAEERRASETAKSALAAASASDERRAASERAERETLSRDAERAARRARAFVPYARGLDLLGRGGFGDEAAKLFAEALATDPDFAEAAFAHGRALRQIGDPAGAATAFLEADAISRRVSGQPDPPALLEAAFANDDAGNYRASLSEFAVVSAAAPASCIGAVAECFAAGENEDFKGSLACAQRALQLEPRMWEAHFALGYALTNAVMTGVLPHAQARSPVEELRTAVRMAPGRGEPITWLALALHQASGALDPESQGLLDQAVAAEPRNATRYLLRASIQAAQSGPDDARVRADMAKAEAIGITVATRARTLMAMAYMRHDPAAVQARYAEIPESERLAEDCSHALAARLGLGITDELQRAIDANLRAYPASPLASDLASAAALAACRWSDALAHADAGLARAPYNPSLLLHRLMALTQLGRDQQALAQADAILRGWPACAGAMEAEVVLLVRAGRTDEAHALYQRLVAGSPASKAHLHRVVEAMQW